MKMKKSILLAAILGVVAVGSCNKEQSAVEEDTDCIIESDLSPIENFSIILSRAVASNESLREFIKSEAGSRFDRDFDVLYGRVKDKLVEGDKTFRCILAEYDTDNLLPSIENELPLLNILVPDWSIIGGFCLDSWDTSDGDISVACKTSGGHPVYCEGEKIGELEPLQIPGFPTLIVKNNERVKVSAKAKTKAGADYEYEFLSDVFDARNYPETKLDHEYYDREINTEDYSNFLPASEVSAEAIEAYNIFKDNKYACHRDNIYYGMTNEITQGRLNKRVSEYIVRYRFESLESDFLFDDDNRDFTSGTTEYTRYVAIDDETLIDHLAYDGDLEVYFHFLLGTEDGAVKEVVKYQTIPFKTAFQLSKVHVDFRHKTWVTDRKWVFTIDKKCFEPKWIKPSSLDLPKWDISGDSFIMNIKVYEYDEELQSKCTMTLMSSFAQNFSANAEGKIGNEKESGDVKIGYGFSDKKDVTSVVETTAKSGSDDLGTALFYYTDPVILKSDTLDSVEGYRVKEFSTGFVRMLIMPRYE